MNVQLLDDNLIFYQTVLKDIQEAKKSIYLETFRFSNDGIGKKFLNVLIQKAEEGLEIKLLLDAYGTQSISMFSHLKGNNVEVRFFKKFKFFFSSTIRRNNSRNHRKLILIDDEITYIGSSNITSYSISWKELNFRIKDPITIKFKEAFFQNYAKTKLYDIDTFENIPNMAYRHFEIIQDTPSSKYQKMRNQFLGMIKNAEKEVILETPYFLPGYKIRKALIAASERGVNVKLLFPLHSDLRTTDILRNHYLGNLHKAGITQLFYKVDNLHAKSMVVDRHTFLFGSSNFDYRSFRYQFEIGLKGCEPELLNLLQQHFDDIEEQSILFDYDEWKSRSGIDKLFETLMLPIRRLF